MSNSGQNLSALPPWAREMIALYGSRAVNQFILHGNVNDRFYLPLGAQAALGGIRDFLHRVLLPRFDLILSYDLGNGIRIEKGGEIFSQWTGAKESPELPRQPRFAIEFLTRYFRYAANLARLGKPSGQVACYIRACISLLRPCQVRSIMISTRSPCSCAIGRRTICSFTIRWSPVSSRTTSMIFIP